DNAYLPATAGTTVAVSGTYIALDGSHLDVNGNAGTLTPNPNVPSSGTFSGSAAITSSGVTPIVVRLTQPDGTAAVATAVVTKLGTAPSIKLSFPAAEATAVDPGIVVLVSFSAPM